MSPCCPALINPRHIGTGGIHSNWGYFGSLVHLFIGSLVLHIALRPDKSGFKTGAWGQRCCDSIDISLLWSERVIILKSVYSCSLLGLSGRLVYFLRYYHRFYYETMKNFTGGKRLLWYFCDGGVGQFRQSLCEGDTPFEVSTYVKSRCPVVRRRRFPKNSNTLPMIRDGCGIYIAI